MSEPPKGLRTFRTLTSLRLSRISDRSQTDSGREAINRSRRRKAAPERRRAHLPDQLLLAVGSGA